MVPSLRPVRAGVICLFAAITLALAAGTFGLGAHARYGSIWSQHTLETNGGAIGATLYWTASHLFSDVGAHILAVFLFLAGLLLLSGVTIASLLASAGRGVAETGRRAATLAPQRPLAVPDAEPTVARKPVMPPEPEDDRLVVRATHVEAPSLDGAARYPDLFGDDAQEPVLDIPEPEESDGPVADPLADPDTSEIAQLELEEPDEPGVLAERGPTDVDPADLTPQGRYRANVTDDPSFVWRTPSGRTRPARRRRRPPWSRRSATSASRRRSSA